MAIIEINFNPSKRELQWFGGLMLLFFGLVGGLVYLFSASVSVTALLWTVGLVLCAVYYAVTPMQRVLYTGWMRAVQPIAWTVSHLLFGIIYYVVFTSTGLVLRLVGHDPLNRRMLPQAQTYWVEHRAATRPSQYFRQF